MSLDRMGDPPPAYAECVGEHGQQQQQQQQHSTPDSSIYGGSYTLSWHPESTAHRASRTAEHRELQDPDVLAYTSNHALLVVVCFESRDEAPPTSFFLNWTPTDLAAASPPPPSLVLTSRLTLEQLQHIQGFRNVGSLLPPSVAQDYVEAVVTQNLERLGAVVAAAAPSCPWRRVEIVTIAVFTHADMEAKKEEGAALFAQEARMLWKWQKPTNVYARKTGFWGTDIDEAVTDGEWAAGKNLRLLACAIPEDYEWDASTRKIIFNLREIWRTYRLSSLSNQT